ncbi:MAG: response regulator [Methylococcaceae bacterium]|nr:MAG: response regulator [Methylococcaceae bacterium]
MNSAKTLLIVDDSRVARLMLRNIISVFRPQWRIVEAENAETALAAATAESPHYATLDYNMPGMNGMELAEQLLKSHPMLKAVLLTANIQDPIRQRALALGLSFVAKPITEKSCMQIVELLGE